PRPYCGSDLLDGGRSGGPCVEHGERSHGRFWAELRRPGCACSPRSARGVACLRLDPLREGGQATLRDLASCTRAAEFSRSSQLADCRPRELDEVVDDASLCDPWVSKPPLR